ncbi:MAG: hypothetical protein PHE83_09905 [Opitutaceae bacterium]|nr:hypothetical protein [Opitutaceae bacterium]
MLLLSCRGAGCEYSGKLCNLRRRGYANVLRVLKKAAIDEDREFRE